MSTIKGNDKKERKPRSAAQLEATAKLVKLNKERAVLRAEGKLPPVQRKRKTKTVIQEIPKEPKDLVKPEKPKKKKSVKKKAVEPEPEPEPEPESEPDAVFDCECEADVLSQSSESDNEYYNYHCDDGGAEGVEDVYTEIPQVEPELEPEPVKMEIVKPKRKRRVYK